MEVNDSRLPQDLRAIAKAWRLIRALRVASLRSYSRVAQVVEGDSITGWG